MPSNFPSNSFQAIAAGGKRYNVYDSHIATYEKLGKMKMVL